MLGCVCVCEGGYTTLDYVCVCVCVCGGGVTLRSAVCVWGGSH